MTSVHTAATGTGSAVDVYTALARISRTLRHEAGSGSLTLGSTSALWVLVSSPPMRLSELAARERVTAPTMSRIVSGLERDGMVARTADPLDGRASLITATDAAIELITSTTSRRARLMEEALSRLSDDDRAAAERSIALLAESLIETVRSRPD
ncbi:MarR family winged helix-turn-helix transcriptional regulator [Williamsia sp. MIQD14]|uniref:MarR family winged helix-turn-helix transcriptional regulator n=1 Tax=Williamsia sp. MIQD14 TaxID=3425703 RepID=UPI003D9FD919